MSALQANRTDPRQLAQAAPVRPPEMNDWLNSHIFHPLAHLLAKGLRPLGVSANAVSVGGGLMVAAAAYFYVGLDRPASVLLGFTAHMLWHVLDGADGELARLNGTASPAGELIDGVCDYASHIFLYTLLSIFLFDSIGHWCWPLVSVAGASRVLQANHAESQRRIYLWRVYGVPWLRQAQAGKDELFESRGPLIWISTALARSYIALADMITPVSAEIDEALARNVGGGRDRERVRRLCRRAGRGPLRLQGWLGANPRTIILGLSMATGTPLWFFLIEVIPLNLLLVWSVAYQKKCNLRLGEQLAVGA